MTHSNQKVVSSIDLYTNLTSRKGDTLQAVLYHLSELIVKTYCTEYQSFLQRNLLKVCSLLPAHIDPVDS